MTPPADVGCFGLHVGDIKPPTLTEGTRARRYSPSLRVSPPRRAAVRSAPRARPRGCSGRPRRTSAWREGPRAGRSRRRRSPPRRTAGPAITFAPGGLDDRRAAAAEDLLLGQRHREVRRERRRGDVLRHGDDEGARLDRDVAHGGEPAVGVVGGRRDPDLRAAAVDARSGPAASGSPSRSARRSGPTGVSTTREVVAAPIPWNRRSCMVGISLRCGAADLPARGSGACCRASRAAPPRAR